MLDPQGKAVIGALDTLGFKEVKDLRVGKFVEIELEAATKDEAKKARKGDVRETPREYCDGRF